MGDGRSSVCQAFFDPAFSEEVIQDPHRNTHEANHHRCGRGRSFFVQWYGELGYTSLRFHDSGFNARPAALRAIVGYNFHPNVAVEGMVAGGLSKGSANVGGTDVDVKLQNAYGVFVKPKVNVDNFELFARLGWTNERVHASSAFGSSSASDDSFAWGVGASYNITPKAYVALDFLRYYSKDSSKIDGWTLGAGYHF